MLATYIPDNVTVTYGSLIVTGWQDGTRISISSPKDDWAIHEGTDLISRSLQRSGLYLVTISLQQTSIANDTLSFFSNQDIATGVGVKPFSIVDTFGTSKLFSKSAFLMKKPDSDFAVEVGVREWVVVCPDVTGEIVGGNVTI